MFWSSEIKKGTPQKAENLLKIKIVNDVETVPLPFVLSSKRISILLISYFIICWITAYFSVTFLHLHRHHHHYFRFFSASRNYRKQCHQFSLINLFCFLNTELPTNIVAMNRMKFRRKRSNLCAKSSIFMYKPKMVRTFVKS